MSKNNFESHREAIEAISGDDVTAPNMPVAEAIQEGENLAQWCIDDKEKLVAAGLDWSLAEQLPERAGACRYVQSIWMRELRTREAAQQEWSDNSPKAFDLRDELVHHFFHAFRQQPDLVGKVQAIAEGGTSADMLQDLSDLYYLGKDNEDLLEAISFDMGLLEKAREWSAHLSEVLAKTNGERADDSAQKILRDKAYTHMKEAMDEIRLHGKYLFWRNEDRKRGYISAYHS